MNIVLFVPEDEKFADVSEVLQKAFPRAKILMASSSVSFDEPLTQRITEALTEGGRGPLFLINPPATPGILRELDDTFKEVGGVKAVPRAVFFNPKGDEDAEFVASVRLARNHFSLGKRSKDFQEPHISDMVNAIKLASKSKWVKRVKILLPLFLIAAAVPVGAYLARDIFLKKVLVDQAQGIFQAKAEAGTLVTTLTPSIRIEGFSVADKDDPMKNLFEFETLSADMEIVALVKKRVHVKELALEGLKFGTPRKESGAIPGAEKSLPVEEPLEAPGLADRLGKVFKDLEEKLRPPDPEEFETVKLGRSIVAETKTRSEKFRKRIEGLGLEAKSKKAGEDLKGLFDRPMPQSVALMKELVKDASSIQVGEEELTALRKGVESLAGDLFAEEKKEILAIKADLSSIQKTLKRAAEAVKTAKRIKKVTLFDVPRIQKLLEEYDALSRALPRAAKKLEAMPKRLETIGTKLAEKKSIIDGNDASAKESLSKARKALEENAPRIAKAYQSIQAGAEEALADLEKEKQAVLGTLGRLEGDLSAWKGEVEELGGALEKDLTFLQGELEKLPGAMEKDREMLEEKYSLDAFDGNELLKPLVGEQLLGWVITGYKTYKRFLPLLEGRNFSFGGKEKAPTEAGPPTVWVESIRFTGEIPVKGDILAMKGEVSHLATDIRYTKKPVRITFDAEKGKRKISGSVEYHPENRFTLHMEASGFPVSGLEFKGKYVPRSVEADSLSTTLDVEIEEGKMGGKIRLALAGVRFETAFEGMNERIASVLSRVFDGIRRFSGEFAMDFDEGKLVAFHAKTDLADELGKAFVDAFGAEVKVLRDEAMELLREEAEGSSGEARKGTGGFRTSEGGRVDTLRQQLASLASSLGGDRTKLETGFTELEGQLSLSGDPTAATELQGREIEVLGGKLDLSRKRADTDHWEQEALVKELTESMKGEEGKLGTTKADLKREMDRLKQLLKKAVGG